MAYRMYYAGIRVRDLRKSTAFYTRALGMRLLRRGTADHGGKWVHLRDPESGQDLELNWYPRGSRFYTPWKKGTEMDHLSFRVGDVEKAFRNLVRKGAGVAIPPSEAGGDVEVYVTDPDGIWIELLP